MLARVDKYLIDGCGRCSLVGTPQCKVNFWREQLILLRELVLESGLTEDVKWSMPTYTLNGKNVLMIAAFKDHCVLSFFKGSLLKDKDQLLDKPGENSNVTRWFKFTESESITKNWGLIKAYISEAVELEKSGAKVKSKPVAEYEVPEELKQKFIEDPKFKQAFYALTPGRQKGYLIHFSQAKQSETRLKRIEKYVDHIFNGKGFQDR